MGCVSLKEDLKLGVAMSFETKMYLRLATPCALALLVTMLFTWVASTLSAIPVGLGAPALWPDLPMYVFLVGAFAFLLISGIQIFRLWQRDQGKANVCMVCLCLLGSEKDGRFGPYRKCLGCEKNYSLTRL
jgi:hypothetical protein